MTKPFPTPLRVIGHDCYEDKQSGRRSFSIEAAFALGEPAVKLYVSDTEAAELKDQTGNGFLRDERAGSKFQPYDATGMLALKAKQVVRRGDKPNQDRVNNQLGVKLVGIEFVGKAKAA